MQNPAARPSRFGRAVALPIFIGSAFLAGDRDVNIEFLNTQEFKNFYSKYIHPLHEDQAAELSKFKGISISFS